MGWCRSVVPLWAYASRTSLGMRSRIREGLLILPLELGIFQLLQNALVSRLIQGL